MGAGGDCKSENSSSTGEHEINLANTPFQFMGGLIFAYNGWNAHHHSRMSAPRYSFLTGSGNCGREKPETWMISMQILSSVTSYHCSLNHWCDFANIAKNKTTFMKRIEIDHLEGSSNVVQLKIFLGTVIKSTNLTRHYSMTKQYNSKQFLLWKNIRT